MDLYYFQRREGLRVQYCHTSSSSSSSTTPTPTTTTAATTGCNTIDCHLEYLIQIEDISHCLRMIGADRWLICIYLSKNLTKNPQSQDNSESQLFGYQSALKLQTRSPCLTAGQAVLIFCTLLRLQNKWGCKRTELFGFFVQECYMYQNVL